MLQSGDVIRIAELELTFYQSTRDPVTLPSANETPLLLEFDDVEVALSSVSLHIEIQGLKGELRRTLRALAGKCFELPALKIRIADDGLD